MGKRGIAKGTMKKGNPDWEPIIKNGKQVYRKKILTNTTMNTSNLKSLSSYASWYSNEAKRLDGLRKHSLLFEGISEIPAMYETENIALEDKIIHVKYFVGGSTWLIAEFDPETGEAFGRCDLGMGFPEWGYVNINELAEGVSVNGLVERDLYFEPTKFKNIV